ncbi:MAG: hypothetical protein ACK559_25320, partial [bacterium]
HVGFLAAGIGVVSGQDTGRDMVMTVMIIMIDHGRAGQIAGDAPMIVMAVIIREKKQAPPGVCFFL